MEAMSFRKKGLLQLKKRGSMFFVNLKRARSLTLFVQLVLLLGVSLVPVVGILACQQVDGEKDEVVIAEGVGIDHSSALKDAFRNAVRQVVGAMLDADTVIENDQVIEEKVLMFSDGLVNSGYEELGSKSIEGLVRVKIKAGVKKKSISDALKPSKIYSAKVDGDKLFAESASLLESENSAQEILKKHLGVFHASVFDVEVVGDPNISRIDNSQVRVVWRVQLKPSSSGWKDWNEKASPLLKAISTQSHPVEIWMKPISTQDYGKMCTVDMFKRRYDKQHDIERFLTVNKNFFLDAQLGLFQWSMDDSNPPADVTYVYFNESKSTSLKASKWRVFELQNDLSVNACRVTVQLKEASGDTVQETVIRFSRVRAGYPGSTPGVYASPHHDGGNIYYISPGMPLAGTFMTEMLLPAVFEMSPDELASVKEVRVSIESDGLLREDK